MLAMPSPPSARLSTLQISILTAAYRNHVAEQHVGEEHRRNGGKPEMDLYYDEVLAQRSPIWVKGTRAGRWIDPAGEAKRIRENPGNQWFKRGAINSKGYNDAQASLSRAVKRLEARGLVVSIRTRTRAGLASG